MIYRGILLIWMSVPVLIYGSSTEELQYHFSQDDSSYSFHGSFIVEAELACLISLVYDFEHISKYASGATAVELIRQEDNWTEVRYTYRKFIFFENKSTWRRTLNRDDHELVFEMRHSLLKSAFIDQFFFSKDYSHLKYLINKLNLSSDNSNETVDDYFSDPDFDWRLR